MQQLSIWLSCLNYMLSLILYQSATYLYFICHSYLNNSYIKKQKYSEADVNYGVFPVDADCLLEIGEVILYL